MHMSATSILAQSASIPGPTASVPLDGAVLPSPLVILGLCVLGAVGMGLLLPSRRSATLRRLGGGLAAVGGLIFLVLLARYGQLKGWAGETGVYFWAFSAIAIVSAVRVVTHPRPVYSALYFVMTVFASAGLFVLLWAQFMAAALVLIYAGAVLVTYVFVIMLAAESAGGTGSQASADDADKVARDPFLAGVVGFTLLGVLLVVIFDKASEVRPARPVVGAEQVMLIERENVRSGAFQEAPVVTGDTQRLGQYLYQQQLVPVQLAMLILTLAMTGAVIISRRKIIVPVSVSQAGKAPGVSAEQVVGPATPTDDNPHTIPVYGTQDAKAKAYPQT